MRTFLRSLARWFRWAGAGVLLFLVALWAAKTISRGRRSCQDRSLEQFVFRHPLAVFGAEHLSGARFIMLSVPSYMPWRLFWRMVCVTVVLSMATRFRSLVGLLFGGMMFSLLAMVHIRESRSPPGSTFGIDRSMESVTGGELADMTMATKKIMTPNKQATSAQLLQLDAGGNASRRVRPKQRQVLRTPDELAREPAPKTPRDGETQMLKTTILSRPPARAISVFAPQRNKKSRHAAMPIEPPRERSQKTWRAWLVHEDTKHNRAFVWARFRQCLYNKELARIFFCEARQTPDDYFRVADHQSGTVRRAAVRFISYKGLLHVLFARERDEFAEVSGFRTLLTLAAPERHSSQYAERLCVDQSSAAALSGVAVWRR